MVMITRSMKGNESNENDPISTLPLELKVEIVTKLPPKYIVRLSCVSKHWSSITSGKEFTDLYLTRSSTRPRLLFSVYRGCGDMQTQFFHSCSQDDPTSSSSDHDKVTYTLNSDQRYMFTPTIRGLICGRNGNKLVFGNPGTGHFMTLPQVKTRKKNILSVLGYDPVNDAYKVLCMTVQTKRASRDVMLEDVMSEEHQVITLGAKQKWRMVECKYLHRHESGSQGIRRDGVVYYLASYNKKRSLMSFDLRSEEFNVTKLPEDYNVGQFGNLVNQTGKITIASQAYGGPIDLWVLEDAKKGEWSKVAVVVPIWEYIPDNDRRFIFRGILGTGEIILAPLPSPNPFFFLCYDLKENFLREVVVEEIGDDDFADDIEVQVFFDHVESPMFLKKL